MITAAKYLPKKGIIFPKKKLGQNFLTDANIVRKVIAAANLKPNDTVLEIGPGTGILTCELAKTAKKVVAVEFDQDLIGALKESLKDFGNVILISGDIRRFDERKIESGYKIAANLPFYLTAPIIRKFLESENPPKELTLIVQKEVAQRIIAKPPQMSLLAVSVQFYAKPKIVSYISKNCFWPSPKVDSAILKITPKIQTSEKKLAEVFFKIAKAGFSHPRKQLINNLSNSFFSKDNREGGRKKIETWFKKCCLDPAQRAETLTVGDWINLAKTNPL